MKVNITLAIRATDDPSKVQQMLEFLRGEGILTESDAEVIRPPSPNIPPSVLARFGPNETAWKARNAGVRAPVFSLNMRAKYPSKEAMFAAALDGSLTQAAIDAAPDEPNTSAPAEGAVLTGPFSMPEPSEEDFA
jgi:hypothetical protein